VATTSRTSISSAPARVSEFEQPGGPWTVFWEMFNLFNTKNFLPVSGELAINRVGVPQAAGPDAAPATQDCGFDF